MLKDQDDLRRKYNIRPSTFETNEVKKLEDMQKIDRQQLQQQHETKPHPQQKELQSLLDHQHLADRVGTQAKWMAHELKERGAPQAARYEGNSRQAFQAGRDLHGQRQSRDRDSGNRNSENNTNKQSQTAERAKTSSHSMVSKAVSEILRSKEGKERTGNDRDQGSQINTGKGQGGGRGGGGGGRSR
jgi:hypothetical protein